MTEPVSDEDGKGGATMPNSGQRIKGWGVYRKEPWDFVGLFPTRAEAEREREKRAGDDYAVALGSATVGSDEFEVSDHEAIDKS